MVIEFPWHQTAKSSSSLTTLTTPPQLPSPETVREISAHSDLLVQPAIVYVALDNIVNNEALP